jgi:hypothetical protein
MTAGSGAPVFAQLSAPGIVELGFRQGAWNLSLDGGTGVQATLERAVPSPNHAIGWVRCTSLGVPVTLGSPNSEVITEPQAGVLYRLNVTAIASGTLSVLASQ